MVPPHAASQAIDSAMVGSFRWMSVCDVVPKSAALVACLGLFGCAGSGTSPPSPGAAGQESGMSELEPNSRPVPGSMKTRAPDSSTDWQARSASRSELHGLRPKCCSTSQGGRSRLHFGGTRPGSPRGPESSQRGTRTSTQLRGCRSARRLLPYPTLRAAAFWRRSPSGRIGRFRESMKWTIR